MSVTRFTTIALTLVSILTLSSAQAADVPTALPLERSGPRVDHGDADLSATAAAAAPASGPSSYLLEDAAPETDQPRAFDPKAARAASDQTKLDAYRAWANQQPKTPVEDTAGGDDVAAAFHPSMAQEYAYDIAITQGGHIYAAVQVYDDTSGSEIRVYRSTDGGDSFAYWGERSAVSADLTYRKPSLHIAEGTEDRLFLAYEFHNGTYSTINVAYSDLGANPVWGVRTAISDGSTSFRNPNLTSDGVNFFSYRLYVVAEEADGSSNDIWFSRSTSQGNVFDPAYEIGTLGGNTTDYYKPKVEYSVGGRVHVVWHRGTYNDDNVTDAIRYRGAANFAADPGDWNGVVAITSVGSAFNEDDPTVAASHTNGVVVINFTMVPDGGGFIQNKVRTSFDHGATWDALDEGDAPIVLRPHVLNTPTGFRFWGSRYTQLSYGFAESNLATPHTVGGPQIFADDTYPGMNIVHQSMTAQDPSRNHRLASIWSERIADGTDTLWFDAEWRNDPGYPNHNENFPVALDAPAATPPALADVDGDNRGPEIVFSTDDDKIHVYDRDGLEIPGFPVTVPEAIADESLAVGDLDGDGFLEIVVGTDRGSVFAYDNQGDLVPGWPVDLGSLEPAYVSIGTVSRLAPRDVVATSGNSIHLLRPNGTNHTGWPIATPEPLLCAAAIGDLQGDGFAEIVTAAGDKMRTYDRTGTPGILRTIGGASLVSTPSLGDIDLDGFLEIVVPTDTGELWAFEHLGSNVPNFPIVGLNPELTEAAIADIDGLGGVSIMTAAKLATVYSYRSNGTVAPGFPQATSPGWFLLGAPIVEQIGSNTSEVLIGDRGSRAWMMKLGGLAQPGWPKALGDKVNLSPASGDIDQDGKVEIVLLTDTELVVLDVNDTYGDFPQRRWPMYGYDAQRTSCADCSVDVATALEPLQPASLVSFAPPSPNPSRGYTTFSYRLPGDAAVKLDVYDARGRRVRTLLKSEQSAGEYHISWDGEDDSRQAVSRGQYFARLSVRGSVNEEITRKIVLVP